jgi:hypothetical protein
MSLPVSVGLFIIAGLCEIEQLKESGACSPVGE